MCSIRPAPWMSAITKVSPGGTTSKSRLPPVRSQLDSRRERPDLRWASPPRGLFGSQKSIVLNLSVGSTLDRAEREPGDDVALQDEREKDHGNGVDGRQRRHRAPVEPELGLEVGDDDRCGLRPDRRQEQREEELVPGRQEREDGGDGQATGGQWEDHPPECRSLSARRPRARGGPPAGARS